MNQADTNALLRCAVATVLALLVCFLVARMFWFLHLSVSNALRNDQWPMLEEIRAFRDGRLGWAYLWVPYWGHRIVVPRLILLADERWFGYKNAPLVWINVLAVWGSAAALMRTAWRLLGRVVSATTILALTLIAGLMLSAIQLENFVYGMAVQNTIAFVSAIASVAFMARGVPRGGRSISLPIACAVICTLCFGAGLLLWPILVIEGILLSVNRRVLGILAIQGTLAALVYLYGYGNPAMGMGAAGMFLRPWNAVAIAALLVGGPFSNIHVWLGETVGAFGLLLGAYLLFRAWRNRTEWPPESTVLCAVLLFMVACAFTMSAARISPEWLSVNPKPLPSRYLTFAFIFWSAGLPLAFFDLKHGGSRVMAGGAMLAAGSLLLGFIPAQLDASEQWLRTYRLMDAAAAGFMVGALDQTYMSHLYPENATLARDVPYLKEHRLSVFAETRAEWVGKRLIGVFRVDPDARCSGWIEATTRTATNALCVMGYVAGPRISRFAKTDIVFTDPSGRIDGLGRTLVEDERGGERFLGYAEGRSGALIAWVVGANGTVCQLGSQR